MMQKKDANSKSETLNPLISLWEKIPSAIRLPVFAVLVIAALIYVKTGDEIISPKAVSHSDEKEKAFQEETVATASGALEEFTGAFIEWPEGEMEAYVTGYIRDNQVLVSLSNLTKEKKFFIDKISLAFKDDAGKLVDAGSLVLAREINPGERTGLFDFKTENKEEKEKAELNKAVRIVDMEVVIKERKASSSSM